MPRRNVGQQVVRDYIPEGDAPTPAERAARVQQRARVQSGIVLDFIPGEGHELAAGRDREAAGEEALERALTAQKFAAKQEWDSAVERLQNMNVADAVATIAKMPLASQELYLAAEARHGARKTILGQFPEQDPAVAERYQTLVAEATIQEKEDS